MTALTRRRFLSVAASSCAAMLLGGSVRTDPSYVWNGFALGADATITLWHPDRSRAEDAVRACVAEIDRLENVFSLYRDGSELAALNDGARLTLPSPDMLALLRLSNWFSAVTDGAFDVTVQPLWRVLADHFADASKPLSSLTRELHRARAFVGREHLLVTDTRIVMPEGFGLSFNGIAQGYITDRVADLLRAQGWTSVLVNLGETRALDGRAWEVTTAASPDPISLRDAAVATSQGGATRFEPTGHWNHLIDPRRATCADAARIVAVAAERAAIADALSTVLAIADASEFPAIAARFPGTRVFVRSAA